MERCTLVSTILFYLNLYVMTNKKYKTKNCVFHRCVFSGMNRLEIIRNRAVIQACQPDLVSGRTDLDSVMRTHA